jgi:hypothetical protein
VPLVLISIDFPLLVESDWSGKARTGFKMDGSLDIGVVFGSVNDRVGNGWKVDTSTLIDEEVMMDQ